MYYNETEFITQLGRRINWPPTEKPALKTVGRLQLDDAQPELTLNQWGILREFVVALGRSGPPLIPGAVDGQGGAGMLDIDEEHLAVGREGRASEFGIVHAIVPKAVELAVGRYAD